MRLAVKVVPGASRTRVVGWMEGALKVAVAAPPEGGRANRAVEALLAQALGVSRRAVRIVSGATSFRRIVEIDGLAAAEVRARLDFPSASRSR